MNLNVSHIRLTDRMISDLNEIQELDKKLCKVRGINFDELYGNLSVTGYIADILNRELVRQDACLTFYGVDV